MRRVRILNPMVGGSSPPATASLFQVTTAWPMNVDEDHANFPVFRIRGGRDLREFGPSFFGRKTDDCRKQIPRLRHHGRHDPDRAVVYAQHALLLDSERVLAGAP